MNVEITEENKNTIRFKIKKESHGFSNLLLNQLQNHEDVKIAQYDIEHPKLGEPDFYLKTKGKKPKKVLKEAADQIKEQVTNLKKQAS